jgi:Yip1 domain
MSAPITPAMETPAQPKLSELQRIANIFIAPSQTFADIKRSARWWVPLVISAVTGIIFVTVAAQQIGWEQLQENQVKIGPESQREQFERATPEQRATGLTITKVISYMFPTVFIPVFLIIVALILWGTFNMGAGARFTFHQAVAIVTYSSLIWIVKTVLAIIVLFAGVQPENFYFQNPVGTNYGYFMDVTESNPFLYNVATAIDPIQIWTLILTAIGFSIVGNVKRGTAYAIVFGWWAAATVIGGVIALATR